MEWVTTSICCRLAEWVAVEKSKSMYHVTLTLKHKQASKQPFSYVLRMKQFFLEKKINGKGVVVGDADDGWVPSLNFTPQIKQD